MWDHIPPFPRNILFFTIHQNVKGRLQENCGLPFTSDGRYTKIYGPQDTAFETIQEMIMNHRLFYTKGNLFYPEPEHGFVDFRGTIEEEFTIFWYRIFNDEDYLKLKEVVTLMQNDKYDEAELKFCQLGL